MTLAAEARPAFLRPSRLASCLVAASFAASCSSHSPETRFAGETMGTTYVVKVVGEFDAQQLRAMEEGVAAALESVNARMSTYIPDSELSRLNRARSTDWIEVSDELFAVLAEAQQVSRMTDGAFDATVGPLVNLWGFGPDEAADAPSDASIKKALQSVGYQGLELRKTPPAVRKLRGDLYIDLSAIAKGYAVDKAADVLAQHGAANFLIEVGGELRVAGRAADGARWRIGIERPVPGRRTAFQLMHITKGGVATSGDYNNFRVLNGQRYSHEIDTRTGRPVTHNTASVTVVAESAMRADALATALIVMGAEQGLAFAEREGIAAHFIEWRGEELQARHTKAFGTVLGG